MCQTECSIFGYNRIMKKCRTHKKIMSGMFAEAEWRYYSYDVYPTDCKDLREDGHNNSGVYEAYPFGTSSRPVRFYCDMETMDGGWTAIQKRIDGFLRFDKNWTEYKNGFGDPEQNVWIGNDVIHQLTKGKDSSLYVSIALVNGTTLYELYDKFSVSSETKMYQLLLGNATGTLGDGMLDTGDPRTDLSGAYFSTPDKDNDGWSSGSCAVNWGGGWWFNDCYYTYLNGPWSPENWVNPWFRTVTSGTIVRETRMLIKRH